MNKWHGRLPALLLAAILLSTSPLVPAGGRDVPDHIAEGTSESSLPPLGSDCGASAAVTSVGTGLLAMDVLTAPDGTVTLQSSLLRQAGQVLNKILAPGGDKDTTCTAD
jgi:hypothetical protein